MTVFTEGRLATYERMMQDYDGRGKSRKSDASDKQHDGNGENKSKAGDSHAGNKS